MKLERHFRGLGIARATGAALALGACGVTSTPPELSNVLVTPDAGLAVGIGGAFRFHVIALAEDGAPISDVEATWTSSDEGVATVADGVATGMAEGTATITASVAEHRATATLTVYVPEPVASYEPGVTYLGRNGYTEYIPGTLPIVLAAPHGGHLIPSEIPNPGGGPKGSEIGTVALTRAVRQALLDLTGEAPHLVLSHVHPGRLDVNLDVGEAARGSPFAEHAWEEYHAFVGRARTVIEGAYGGGMFFDMHGHEHPEPRIELGYLLPADRLNRADVTLNSLATVQLTSIRELGRTRPDTFADLLRGMQSLGGLLEAEGYVAMPSPTQPSPGADPYVPGGYGVARHGSMGDTQLVSGVHIEHPAPGVLDSSQNRTAYAAAFASAARAFMLEHFGFFQRTP